MLNFEFYVHAENISSNSERLQAVLCTKRKYLPRAILSPLERNLGHSGKVNELSQVACLISLVSCRFSHLSLINAAMAVRKSFPTSRSQEMGENERKMFNSAILRMTMSLAVYSPDFYSYLLENWEKLPGLVLEWAVWDFSAPCPNIESPPKRNLGSVNAKIGDKKIRCNVLSAVDNCNFAGLSAN